MTQTGYVEDYWDHHDRGTHGRPRPGTRVLITSAPHRGHKGTVAAYEGCWSSRCFPVAVDFVGRTAIYDTDCVSEVAS